MSNVPSPTPRDMLTAGVGSLVFVALGVGMLSVMELSLPMRVVAWAAAVFGMLGVVGVALRLSGRTLGPDDGAVARRRSDKLGRQVARQMADVRHQGPLPELSARKQGEVRRIVRAMAAHGLFAPELPDPALLFAGVAEQDWPVKPDSILEALGEVGYYHPGTDPERWMANLVMHGSKGEQGEVVQIGDLARLTQGLLDIRDVDVRHAVMASNARAVRVDATMTVDGAAVALSYNGDVKYLSTHIHYALATRLHGKRNGKRLAWLWTDEGAWISLVEDGAVEALNAALKLTDRSRCVWIWVDESAPIAAGAISIEGRMS